MYRYREKNDDGGWKRSEQERDGRFQTRKREQLIIGGVIYMKLLLLLLFFKDTQTHTEKGEAQIQKRCMKSNQHHNLGLRSIHT